MEILRRPIIQVWEKYEQSTLPQGKKPISIHLWHEAKKLQETFISLPPAQQTAFLDSLSQKNAPLATLTQSIPAYRATRSLQAQGINPERFLQTVKLPKHCLHIVRELLAHHPAPDLSTQTRAHIVSMQSLQPTEGFMLSLKLAFFAGIIISFPLLLYFLLSFILPGLKESEKKALFPALGIGCLLFASGILFSYFFVLPEVLAFFYQYNAQMGIINQWRIGEYIAFATQFTLIFGVGFELPVVVMTLVKIGILSYPMMAATRSYAILSITVIAAVITPTQDIATLCFLAVPMVILYEICIWLAYFDYRKKAPLSPVPTPTSPQDHDATYYSQSYWEEEVIDVVAQGEGNESPSQDEENP